MTAFPTEATGALASCPSAELGGHPARPTILDYLFVGVP